VKGGHGLAFAVRGAIFDLARPECSGIGHDRIRRSFAVPPADLQPLVERIWSWESNEPCPLPLVLPGTGCDLLFHYRAPFTAAGPGEPATLVPRAHVTCLRSAPRQLGGGPVGFVAVRFRSTAIRHFGVLRLDELIDRFADAREHFGPEVADVANRVEAAPDFSSRATLLVSYLRDRLTKANTQPDINDRLVAALYYGAEHHTVGSFSEHAGYSRRQLERTFAATAGVSPKTFQRIARFQHTIRRLLLARRRDYLDAALGAGYHDQAHFIHEARALTGHTPLELLTPAAFLSHFYNPSLSPSRMLGGDEHRDRHTARPAGRHLHPRIASPGAADRDRGRARNAGLRRPAG
jgi:AraC-like DNA-binding protein